MWMCEAGECPYFSLESLWLCRRRIAQHLDRNVAVQSEVASTKDLAHAPAAELLAKSVAILKKRSGARR
jgi:hypothetical protein